MKTMVPLLLVACLAGCGGKTFGQEKNVTVEPARAVIVSTHKDEAKAVTELRLHLKLVTGHDVPVATSAGSDAFAFRFEPGIVLGNKEACAWDITPTNVTFRGHAYFAVVDFLENALDVRWPEGDKVSYRPQSPLRLRVGTSTWTPDLKIRIIRSSKGTPANRIFSDRMRFGSHDAPKYGHAFTGHWKKYGRDHRDYFAMRKDGLRGPQNAKPEELLDNVAVYAADTGTTLAMCCTSTGLVSQIILDWIAAGKPGYINLCENDVPGQNSCQCPSCKALDVVPAKVDPKWETHYADRYVYFGNQVLKTARPHRADVKVAYYAYNASQDAPRKIRPDAASVIGLVPTSFTYADIVSYVDSWKKAGAEHFFYRPNRHHYYRSPYLPTGQEEHFFKIFQYLVSQGTLGFDYDAPAASPGGFDWFERYILQHAMQDPSKPFAHWEDHFFQAHGAAKDDVKAYYRFWREEVWNKRLEPNIETIVAKGRYFNFGRGLVRNLNDYYRSEDFDAAERFVAAAEACPTEGPQRSLVKDLRVAHDHARLFFEAVAHKSKANTEALVAYCKAHGYPLYTWSEQYFGDVTGVEKLLGPEKVER